VPVTIFAPLGLPISTDGVEDGDGNHIYLTSDRYYAAALFAGSQQLFKSLPVPLSHHGLGGNWSITPIKLPKEGGQTFGHGRDASNISGNLTLVTHGLDVRANCEMANITFGDNSTVTATVDGCSFSFPAQDTTFPRWHFATSVPCHDTTPAPSDKAFRAFVYAVYKTSGYNASDPDQFAVTFCRPSVSIAMVQATVSIIQGTLGALVAPPVVLESFSVGSPTSDPAVAKLLGAPLYGRAVNGFDMAEPQNASLTSRMARVNITQSILYEGIYAAQLIQMGNDTDDPWCTFQSIRVFYH
jgi:hypothetical protein